MKTLIYILVFMSFFLLSSCGTITRGRFETWKTSSTPSGATVTVSSTGASCKTPCSFELRRNSSFTAVYTKKGYEPYTARVTSGFSAGGGAAIFGNVLFFGHIGTMVDGANGSLQKLDPNPLHVHLKLKEEEKWWKNPPPPKPGEHPLPTLKEQMIWRDRR